jgi:hypothetical protein
MNRPLPTVTPDTVPYRLPTLSATGAKRWAPDVFAAHILSRTNRLGGSILILEAPDDPKPTRKRPRRKPRR